MVLRYLGPCPEAAEVADAVIEARFKDRENERFIYTVKALRRCFHNEMESQWMLQP